MSFIDIINIYGITPAFYVKGNPTYYTKFTLSISIISILVIIFFIIYFGRNLLYKTNLSFFFTSITDLTPLELQLNSTNFVFSFSLQYENYTNFINESIYFLEAYHIRNLYNPIEKKNEQFYNRIEIIKCDKFKFQVIPDYFKDKDLSNLYCLNNSNLTLRGNYDTDDWQYIQIRFNYCHNKSNCEDLEIIKEKLSGGYLGMFISDISFQPKNYTYPAVKNGVNKYTTISSFYYKDYWLYLKNVIIETDQGLVFTNIKKDYFYSIDSSTTEYIDFRKYEYNFFNVYLRASQTHDEYHRTYTKATSVIADISGMFKLIMVIGNIICITTDIIFYKLYILSFFDLNDTSETMKKNILSLNQALQNFREKNQESNNNNNNDLNNITLNKMPSLYQIYNEGNNRPRTKKKRRANMAQTIIMTRGSILGNLFKKNDNNNNDNNNNNYYNSNFSATIKKNLKELDNYPTYRNNEIIDVFKEKFDLDDYFYDLNIRKSRSMHQKRIKFREEKKKNLEENLSYVNLFYLAFCKKNSRNSEYGKKLSNFQNIRIYLDIIRYLKIYHDLYLLKRYILSDKDFKKIESDYLFDKNSKITTQLFYNHFNDYFDNDNKRKKKKSLTIETKFSTEEKKIKKNEESKEILNKENIKIKNNEDDSVNEKNKEKNSSELHFNIEKNLNDKNIKKKKKKRSKSKHKKNQQNRKKNKTENENEQERNYNIQEKTNNVLFSSYETQTGYEQY
jgi:hypothetical protein